MRLSVSRAAQQQHKPFDLSIYFVADPSCCAGRDIMEVVVAAVAGGATMVQYRNKSDDMAQIHAEASMLSELLKTFDVPLIVNDHVDVAFAAGADGVHLGQGDASPEEARSQLGKLAIIGQTAFTKEQLEAVDPRIIDYVGTGPFYETQTDKGKPVLGAETFTSLIQYAPVPVVGIGGITPENARAVIEAGADGVAMMRSISEAEDPQAAAKQFTEVLK